MSSPLQNEAPDFLVNPLATVVSILERFGWFILLGVIACIYIYQKFLPTYKSWKRKQEEYREAEEAKKNPDHSLEIQVSVEQARLRLQEKVNTDATKRKEQLEKEKDTSQDVDVKNQFEEQKRQERIEEWEKHKDGRGYHSKSKTNNTTDIDTTSQIKPKKKTNLRNQDYNPLAGNSDEGSCSWRPGRRNVSGGG